MIRTNTTSNSSQAISRGFSLLELLIVIAIIGMLAAVSVPALKGLGQGNLRSAAVRQVLSDLGLARQLAIKNRTTVYFAFMPPIRTTAPGAAIYPDAYNQVESYAGQISDPMTKPQVRMRMLRSLTNAFAGQLSSYALISRRSLGDQPGRGRERYLTEWRSLPDGMFFPEALFRQRRFNGATNALWEGANQTPLVFPAFVPELTGGSAGPPKQFLPAIGFNANGQVELDPAVRTRLGYGQGIPLPDLYLAIAEGSVFIPKLADGRYDLNGQPDVVEAPRLNYTNTIIRISSLTGRARLDRWNPSP